MNNATLINSVLEKAEPLLDTTTCGRPKVIHAPSESKSAKAKDKSNHVCYLCCGKHLATKCHFISDKCHLFWYVVENEAT